MDTDLLNHYLDTNIIVDYIEVDPDEDTVIRKYMQSSLFNKCTSTTPKNEYNNLCDRIRGKTKKFLAELKAPALAQSKESLGAEIDKQFKIYSETVLANVSGFVKRKVTSFIKDNIPKIVKAVENGRKLTEILEDCTDRVNKLCQKLRSIFAAICHDDEDAQIKFHEVPQYLAEKIKDDDELKPAFEHIKGKNDSRVLAEAYYVRKNILRVEHLSLITTNWWAFLHLTPKHDIQKHLNIHPRSPEDILKTYNI